MKTAKGPTGQAAALPAANGAAPPTRLSVNLNSDTNDDLQGYIQRNQVSITEAVRRAIALLAFVDNVKRQGASLNVVDKEGTIQRVVIL